MKKAAALITLLLYFAATSGIVINSHYCMKKLVSVNFYGKKSKVCGLCKMEMHNNDGCCHDEVKVVKLVQDQVTTPAFVCNFQSPEAAAPVISDFLFTSLFNTDQQRLTQSHSPPILSGQDTYLRINVFRI